MSLPGGGGQALNFLLHNGISSNQRDINQRHLILSERLWDYLETPFLLLKSKRGSRGKKKRKKKTIAERITDKFKWFCHLSLLLQFHFTWIAALPVIRNSPLASPSYCEIPNKSTVYFLSTQPAVVQAVEIYHMSCEMTSAACMCHEMYYVLPNKGICGGVKIQRIPFSFFTLRTKGVTLPLFHT